MSDQVRQRVAEAEQFVAAGDAMELDLLACSYCGGAVAWKGFAPFGSKFSHGECLATAVLEKSDRVDA